MISVDTLETLLINSKKGNKHHFIATCPFCNKELHFYINYDTGMWDCKKCGETGNIVTFLNKLGRLDLLDGRQVYIDSILNNKLKDTMNTTGKVIDITIGKKLLPVGYRKSIFNSDSKFTQYLRTRKFKEIDFWLYDPGYTKMKQQLIDYVIIPVHREGQVKAYVGRYLGTDPLCPRYLNSKDDFNKLMFGYDELRKETKTVILVEGVFDKISVTTELGLHQDREMKCLATFGKKISEAQVYLLKAKGIDNLIFMYDGTDAVSDMKNIASQLTTEFKNILLCYTGKNDPGESDRNQLFNYLSEAKNPNDFWLDKVNKLQLK